MSTEQAVTIVKPDISALSAMSPDIARQRPLGELVEATITAAAGTQRTARQYRRAIGDFCLLLQDRVGLPLVDKRTVGKRGKVEWSYHPVECRVLLAVDSKLLDAYRAEYPVSAYNAVRTFLAVALRDNVLTVEQATALGVKPYRPRQKRKRSVTGRRLTALEVQVLRAALGSERVKDIRDKLIVDLALFAGLRRDEIATLRLSAFRRDGGRLYLQFVGKGGFERKIAVHKDLHNSLAAWLEVADLELFADAPLFARVDKGENVTWTATGITAQAVSNLVVALGATAGLAPAKGKTVLSPHDLRRTFARRLYDLGVGLEDIRILLGHADVKTTALYIGVNADGAKDAVDRLSY